jgi:hypothetical protein
MMYKEIIKKRSMYGFFIDSDIQEIVISASGHPKLFSQENSPYILRFSKLVSNDLGKIWNLAVQTIQL